jgi:hypothetical protein
MVRTVVICPIEGVPLPEKIMSDGGYLPLRDPANPGPGSFATGKNYCL